MGLAAEQIINARCKDEWMEIVILASYGQSSRAVERMRAYVDNSALTVAEVQEIVARTRELLDQDQMTEIRFWLNGQTD